MAVAIQVYDAPADGRVVGVRGHEAALDGAAADSRGGCLHGDVGHGDGVKAQVGAGRRRSVGRSNGLVRARMGPDARVGGQLQRDVEEVGGHANDMARRQTGCASGGVAWRAAATLADSAVGLIT